MSLIFSKNPFFKRVLEKMTDGQNCSNPRANQRLFSRFGQNLRKFPSGRLNVYENAASIRVGQSHLSKTEQNSRKGTHFSAVLVSFASFDSFGRFARKGLLLRSVLAVLSVCPGQTDKTVQNGQIPYVQKHVVIKESSVLRHQR